MMDDNDNILDFQKMNFSPFAATQFAGLSANAVNQFAASKFAHNLTGANGQIVGVVSGGDGGVSYLRPIDTNNSGPFSPTSNHHLSPQSQSQQQQQSMNESSLHQHQQQQQQPQSSPQHQALITLPITMPGAKPGDAAQTVHIQVINPNPIPQPPTTKIHMGQMQIPIQSFQPGGTTVLTVAYSPQDGKFLPNHGFPEGMTVVAALQPQDLQILAQAQAQANAQLLSNQQHHQQQLVNGNGQQNQSQQQNQETALNISRNLGRDINNDEIIVKQEPTDWENSAISLTNATQPDLSEFITTHSQAPSLPMTLTPYLKFNPNSIKYETPDFTVDKFDAEQLINPIIQPPSPIQNIPSLLSPNEHNNSSIDEGSGGNVTINGGIIKQKRKRRIKKPKVVKPKPPKPGQVLIATTTDGTVLFCCPECQMAYPEKENLEQHLTEHKIERRYICDICGAGLKRKEHLERHKSGHNPERPYICSVCMKGFKRKEHLNLHFVIHSGEKNEICGECGKGFYRKDHLRKHTNSHIAKRLKEEMNAREGITPTTPKNKKNKNNNNINLLDGSSTVGCGNNNNNNNSISNNNNEINSPLAGNDNNNILMQASMQIGDSINPQQMQLDPIQITSNINNLNNNKNSNSNNSDNNNINGDNNNAINISINSNCGNTQTTQPAIALSTVYVPTSNNTTLPVQIQIPQIITTSKPDGTTESTIVMPTTTTESQNSTTIMSTS